MLRENTGALGHGAERLTPGARRRAALLTSSAMVAAALLLAPAAVHAAPALPTGATVVAGKASISAPSNNYLTVTQSSKNSIINWNSFSVGQGGSVQINNGSGATLNRVTGGSVSSIDGLLSATGSVYLINPNGVIIGKTGVVNTGGTFVASALDVSNSNFLAGGSLTFSGASTASVVNLGKVGSLGGDVALIASTVENDGTITAPDGTVGLIAGQQVTLKDADNDGNGLFSVQLGGASTSVTNTGLIEAANAELRAEQGNVYALAGNTAGVIRATGVDASDGKIWLVADGGTTTVAGTLDAQGANGSAGQIETSGQTVLVDTAAIDAHGGQWLLDPQNIEITAAAANTISSSLANNNVTEQTTSTTASETGTGAATTVSSGAGYITLDAGASISWGSSHALTLNAYNNLNLNGSISFSGAGTLNLTAGQAIAVNAPITVSGAGAVNLTYGGALSFDLGPSGFGGSLTFASGQAGQSLTLNGQAYGLIYSLNDLGNLDGATGNYALAGPLTETAGTAAPIGTFSGMLEGLGNTISGLTITGHNDDSALIGRLYPGAGVSDIGIVGASVFGGQDSGALVGNSSGTVTNSYATGNVNSNVTGTFQEPSVVGGLIGYNNGGTIAGSYATSSVQGTGADVGGLVGTNSGTIETSYATGAVLGASGNTGGLIGANVSGVVESSHATGTVYGYNDTGGLVGSNDSQSTIETSYATGAVSGQESEHGGLVGENNGLVETSYATGAVTGSGQYDVGGLVGDNAHGATVESSYATGPVSEASEIGGLIGINAGAVSTSYSTGMVSGSSHAGGLVGYAYGGTVTNSYWDTQTSGQAGSGGGTGLTTAQLQSNSNGYMGNLGAAFGGGTGGLYPYLTYFDPNGVQAVDGTASVGSQVGVYTGGVLLTGGTVYTGANGYYYETLAAGTLPTNGAKVGATVESNGSTTVTSLTYSDQPLSGGALTLPNVAAGNVSETTTETTYSALQTDLASTFGSANLTALNTALASGSFNITATNSSGFTVNQAVTTGTSGNYSLTTTAGALTLNNSLSVDGNLALVSAGALSMTSVTSGEDLTLTAATSVTASGTVSPGEDYHLTGASFSANVLAPAFGPSGRDWTIVDTASGGFTDASSLEAPRNISISTTGASAPINLSSVTADAGSVTISGTGAASVGAVSATSGNVSIGGAGVTLNNAVSASHLTGTVTLTSTGTISQTAGVITAETLTGSSTGSTTLNDENLIRNLGAFTTTGSGANFSLKSPDLDVTGAVTAGAGAGGSGNLTLTTFAADLDLDANLTANGASGTVSLTSAGEISQNSGVITAATLTGQAESGPVSLTDQNLVQNLGAFTAASLDSDFSFTNNQALDVTGAVTAGAGPGGSGNLYLTTTTGGLTLGSSLTATGASSQVDLTSAGAISQSGASRITATTLTGSSAGATALASENLVGTVSNFTAPGGFSLTNDESLTASGVTSTSGNVTLETDSGSLTLSGPVSDGAGMTLTLNAFQALAIDTPITIAGAGAVNLTYNTAGPTSLSFAEGSSINYGAVNSGGTLKINGVAYTLLYKLADGTDVGPDSGGDDIAGIDQMGESGHYALATSLNGAGTTFTKALAGVDNAFTGTFEGLGNTITGLKISSINLYVGLFDDLNPGAVIRDIGLIGGSVSGGTWTGALVAFDDGGTIFAVYNTGSVSGSGRVGGLIGEIFGGTLTQSYDTGAVQGGGSTGGLVGEVYGGTLTQSYATGAVTGGSSGGLVGNVMDATISNSYATGYVAGDALIGSGSGISASNLYYNSDTTGASSSYGTGLTTSQLKGSLPSGFGAAWATGPGLYPYLTNFFPGGVQAITATTNGAAAGSQVGVYIGGVLLGGATASTGANGAYYEIVAAGTLPTSGLQAGVTVASNGSGASGLAYADNLSLSGGVLTLPSLTSGQVSETTGAATYSALQTNLASTFGAANLTALNATLAAAAVSITATGAGFTLDQAVTANGGLTVTGSSITLDGASLTSSGAVSLDGAVTLADANTITASTTTFAGTVDGAQALTLVGAAQFDDAVGAITTLTSLSVSGASALDGGPVNTTGAQTYSSAATLGADTTLTASNTTFGSTLDGAHALTITGNATLDDAVGASAALSSLSISGASTLDGGRVTTTGTQTYSGAATLGANTTLTASTVNFGSTLDGAYGLTITGKAAFNGAVGGLTELSSLSVSGTSIFDGGAVSTTGAQTYTGAATQDENTTLTAGGLITLGSTLNGKYALSLTGSALQFNGVVGSSQLPTSVTAIATDGNVTLGASGRINSDGAILIAANGDFINNDTTAGVSALKAGPSGYTVYSQDPTNPTTVLPTDTRGGLTGKDYFNDAYDFTTGAFASAVPTGNHFVYGYAATLTYTANAASGVYGSAIPTLGGVVTGFVNGDTATTGTATYTTTATSSSHVADGPFAITGSGLSSVYNYKFVQAAGNATAYTITPADLTITADNQSKVYGAALPTLTVSYSPFANGDTAASLTTAPTVVTTATAASHVAGNPYAITASGAADSDYTISYVAGSLTVTPADLTITADNQSKVYGAALPTLTVSYSPFANGDTAASLTTAPTVVTTATAASHVAGNPYAITASGAVDSDYNISYVAGALTVTPADLTITADNQSKVYGAALPPLTVNYSTFVNGDTAASLTTTPTVVTTATAASHVSGNPYAITASGAVDSDYNISYVAGALTVTPADLTITADNQSKVYGAALPPLTVNYSTFVNGDTAASLTTAPTVVTTATAASHVSGNPYAITASGAVDSDYNISYVAGALTVTPADLTITADNQSKVYGAALPPLTVNYSTFVNGDTAASLTTTPTVITTATAASHVSGNPYAITASGAVDSDYNISYVAGALTVTPEPITITAAANSKSYNDSTSASATPTVTSGTLYDNAVLAETYGSKDVGTGLTLTPMATIANAGDYSVTLASANTGTITAEPITITATANSKTYNDSTSASATPTVTSGTLYDNATFAETYGSKDVGTGLTLTPTATIANAGDYSVTLAPANTGAITAEAITITAAANSKTYNDSTSASATPTVTSGTLYDNATFAETYGSKDVGTGLTLTPTATITNAGDYSVTLASANTGTITAEPITITAAANSKTYNDSTSANATPTVTSGTLYDSATLAETYGSKDVGTGLTLTPTATITNASDYTVTLAPANTGAITAEAITITAAANSKTYDATTSASATPTVTSGTLYDNATLAETYTTKDVGAGLTLVPTATITNAGDYSVTLASANTGAITAEPITITAAANSKTYDSTTSASATPTVTSGTLYDSATLAETYAAKDAGTGLALTPTATITNSGDYAVTLVSANTGVISPEAITITAAANSKTYDSTTSASAAPTVTSGTLYDAANATLGERYTTANAGTGLTLAPTAAIPDASNYTVSLASADTGTIVPEAITITAAANSKTYDSTTSASATPTVTSGTLYDAASATLTESYTTANAGTALTLAPTASIPDASNYSVTLASANTGTIVPEAVSITATANTKTYDGGTSAVATPTVTSGVLYDGATLSETYAGKDAGTGLTLTPAATIANAGDYAVTLVSSANGEIDPKAITASLTGLVDKTYDATTGATLGAGNIQLSGVVAGDTVTASATSATYASANVGTGISVTASGVGLGGAQARDYTLVSTTYSASIGEIDQRPITITANDEDKFVGQPDPALTYQVTGGSFVGADAASGALTRAAGQTPGDYAIQQGSLAVSGNYALTFVGGRFVINPTGGAGSLAGETADQSGFNSASASFTLASGPRYTPSINPQATGSSDAQCHIDRNCINVPYPANLDVSPDIRFVPGL